MVQVLNEIQGSTLSGGYFFSSDLQHFTEIADAASALVICRSRYSPTVESLISAFRAKRRPIYFDVDDLVVDTRYARMILDTLALDAESDVVLDAWFAMISRMGETLRRCDYIISTNQRLSAQIQQVHAVPAFTVSNFMNDEQVKYSAKLFQAKLDAGYNESEFHIGYFSGSPSHRRDFGIASKAIASVLREFNHARLVIVGYIEPGEDLVDLRKQIIYHPFQDFVALQRLVGSVDLNLIPLQNNIFTDCKSELKYFEAGAVGTPSLASPSDVLSRTIEDGRNGLLAYAHEWARKIKSAASQPESLKAIATQAHLHSLSNYSWRNKYVEISKIFESV